jgi:hypothetical protein
MKLERSGLIVQTETTAQLGKRNVIARIEQSLILVHTVL